MRPIRWGNVSRPILPALWRWCACAVVLLVLGLGAVEDRYGRTDVGDLLGSDAVQYLDCARAMDRGDLRAALNPLWNQGCPALLALVGPLFGGTMTGEWWTTRVVNLAIFCFAMGCLRTCSAGSRSGYTEDEDKRLFNVIRRCE